MERPGGSWCWTDGQSCRTTIAGCRTIFKDCNCGARVTIDENNVAATNHEEFDNENGQSDPEESEELAVIATNVSPETSSLLIDQAQPDGTLCL
ncbi:hypothetical protein W02_17990 [Nitrospira sp. KM1]|nr:hypothetical protein W02_17990 [Nitrospira sp. KM1]